MGKNHKSTQIHILFIWDPSLPKNNVQALCLVWQSYRPKYCKTKGTWKWGQLYQTLASINWSTESNDKDYSESIKFVCSSVYILITGCTYRWVFFATAGVSLVIQNVNNSVVSAKGKKLEQKGRNNYCKVDSLIYWFYSDLSESFQK